MVAPTYRPVALGAARVVFTDPKLGIDTSRDVLLAAPITDGAVAVDWQQAERLDIPVSNLQRQPASSDATFADVPAAAQQPKSYAVWTRALSQYLSQSERIEVLTHRDTKLTSAKDEDERTFNARVQDARRSLRDEEVDAVRKKFATKRDGFAERIRKAGAAVEREQQQASDSKTQTMLSFGAAALGAMFGKKILATGNIGRATTAARGVGRSMKEAGDVKRASENVDTLKQQLQELDDTIREETRRIAASHDASIELERLHLAPKRGQISVQFVGLGWQPE
ncbi:MAG: hypothetical protein ABIS06_16070 [Vicinamibacterales bacterium]